MEMVQAYQCSDGLAIVGKDQAEAHERQLRMLDWLTKQVNGTSLENGPGILTKRDGGSLYVVTGVTVEFLADNFEALARVCDLDRPYEFRKLV